MPEGTEVQSAPAPLRRKRAQGTEQVAGSLAAAAVKRTGRKAKARHDAGPAPVDGDYDKLAIENEEPGFRYIRASSRDIPRYKRAGAEIVKHGDRERLREWTEEGAAGAPVRIEELTVLRIREEDFATMHARDPKRRSHGERMGALLEHAKSGRGNFENAPASIQLPV